MSQLAIDKPNLHIAMYPWLAIGHLTPFLYLANKLAERGHKTSFFIPPKTQLKLASFNHHPHLITFIPVPIPQVDGLPDGAETTHDVPAPARRLLMTAMDLTRDTIDSLLARLKPDLIFFDFTQWLPWLARKHGAKSIYYVVTSTIGTAPLFPWGPDLRPPHSFKEADLMPPPPWFPHPGIRLSAHEARILAGVLNMEFGGGMTQGERMSISFQECDAIGLKTCREMEAPLCDFVTKHLDKPVLLAGPMIPGHHGGATLNEDIDGWLKGFSDGSVIYCAFGSESTLEIDQFQELVLGLELTGRPFLAGLKPPTNYETIEEALPEGFSERTKDKGIIHGGWMQQLLILHHPSVGCFVTHCGTGSLSEVLMTNCQIVMLPLAIDYFNIARLMSSYLRVGVEVEKSENDGSFTREDVLGAINLVMEEQSQVGREVKANHDKLRELLSREGFQESYFTEFVQGLQNML